MSRRTRFYGFIAAVLVALSTVVVGAGPAGAVTAPHSRFTVFPFPGQGCPQGEALAGPTSTDDSLVVVLVQPAGAAPDFAKHTLTVRWLNLATLRSGLFKVDQWEAQAPINGFPGRPAWIGGTAHVGAGAVFVVVTGTAANTVQTCNYVVGFTTLTYV